MQEEGKILGFSSNDQDFMSNITITDGKNEHQEVSELAKLEMQNDYYQKTQSTAEMHQKKMKNMMSLASYNQRKV